MNILVYNGSPKGAKSNTLKLTQAFLKGLNERGEHSIKIIDVSKASINHCLGCFNCWTKTPGKCVLKDDMPAILEDYLNADVIIWSFPLYYFGLPSKLKALMDRQLPLNLPYMAEREDGGSAHPSRYNLSQKSYILISTCGFHSTLNNYDAINEQFRILYGENVTKIICPEGELFSIPYVQKRTDEYLAYVQEAGREYHVSGSFSPKTQAKLDELLYPPEAFIEMADASWEVAPTEATPSSDASGTPEASRPSLSKAYNFMKQMAAIYNPKTFSGKEIVLEMYFTDLGETYQLLLGSQKCSIKKEDFSPYTTRIETPFNVWLDISSGKLNGAQAMMEHKYKTLGDFKTMLKLDDYFGLGDSASSEASVPTSNAKKTNMTLTILPWGIIWVFMAINPTWGGILGILGAATLPLLSTRWKLTLYDHLSIFLVSVLSLLALLDIPIRLLVPLSYLFFGLMWTASCLTPIPLTAHYSMNDYNGEVALKNPLFLKTNLILTLCWGILYLVTPIWTYVIMGTSFASLIGLINSLCPILLGLFTSWFEKWYPAKVASQGSVK